MRLPKLIVLLVAGIFALKTGSAQTANASLNIITLNSGQVGLGQTGDVQVTVGNTGPGNINAFKVRAQISIPIAIASALANPLQTGLPAGWTITVNTGGSITVCNGTDVIPAGTQRQIFIKVTGTALGGPSTINGSLLFSNGTSCTIPGTLSGDNVADNTATTSIQVIPAPACSLNAVSAAAGTIACFGGTTTLTATPSFSGAPVAVEYSLNGGAFQLSNTFTVNAAGSPYTITAREVAATTCTAIATPVTVTEPTAITASATAPAILCNGGTTTLTATASGGTGAYEYSLNGGAFQPANTFTVNAAGSPYTVTVRDANLCTAVAAPVTVTEPTAITASATAAPAILCNGGTTTLTVTATGGTGAYEYSLNGGAFQPANTFTVGAGTYTATVRDANGCTASAAPVIVTEPTAITANAVITTPIPLPGGTGTITVSAIGGTGTFTYVITSGTTINTTGVTSGVFTGLLAGNYTFTATDANGCTGTATVALNNPVAGPANASLNILTLNSGQVGVGSVVDVQVTVGNTGPSFIGVNKVRAQISIPVAIASALPNVQQTGLPAGWTITANTGGSITICNGTDQIPSGTQRQILIKVTGTAIGGPSTINGSLLFSNGSSCTIPGTLAGDNVADNTATTSIQVLAVLPVTLTDFTAALANCQPVLTWKTATEINSDRFEIERNSINSSTWTVVGVVAANGNTTNEITYHFTDRTVTSSSDQVLYRLKMVDRDGRAKYSKVLPVFINCNTTRIRVYPNPVQDGKLYVSLTGTSGNTEAILLTLSGQVLLKSKIHNGTNSLSIPALANGIYLLKIKDANGITENVKVYIER
jgi:Secretion system C-terminal sorting domain/SprB repeat